MPQAARITDAVAGTTAGEHTGHVPTHSPEPFSGEISGACSGTVRINGLSAATVGSIYHRAGRVLWIQPGRRGRWERDGADQRETGGPHGRHPGRAQRERDRDGRKP